MQPNYIPFYIVAGLTLFGTLAFTGAVAFLPSPRYWAAARRVIRWGSVAALVAPIAFAAFAYWWFYRFGPWKDDVGLPFELLVAAAAGFGLGVLGLGARRLVGPRWPTTR